MIDIVMPSSKITAHFTRSSIQQIRKLSFNEANIIVVDDNEIKEWGYNKALNYGATQGSADFIFFANNDLIYSKHWDKSLVNALSLYDSVSPRCPKAYRGITTRKIIEGSRTGKELAGWAIMMKRHSWEQIGGFDEDFRFWCCDNAYEEQIKKHRLKHALVTNSVVEHIGSATLNKRTLSKSKKELTLDQIRKFNRKYNRNLFNMGT